MWKYGISAIRQQIQQKSAPLDSSSVSQRRHTRLVYQQLFREHMHSKNPNDLPWVKTEMSSASRAQFNQIRKQLSAHELIAYEGAEMARVFAEKKKYWVEWHAANDGLRFYQSAVIISGVTLTAEEEAEARKYVQLASESVIGQAALWRHDHGREFGQQQLSEVRADHASTGNDGLKSSPEKCTACKVSCHFCQLQPPGRYKRLDSMRGNQRERLLDRRDHVPLCDRCCWNRRLAMGHILEIWTQ